MHPSNFASEVSLRLLPFIREQAAKKESESSDLFSSEIQRTYVLSSFNIVKLDSLSLKPLNDLKDNVKTCALPFLDLPNSRLEELTQVVNQFRTQTFAYSESKYSFWLWFGLLRALFPANIFDICPEFSLNLIESEYINLSSDFCVNLIRGSLGPFLFLELSRDHLLSEVNSHKDGDKIAVSMSASLLKLIGKFSSQGIRFLEKLSVYGILGAASDFDVVSVYPVFPDKNNPNNFYIAFNSSKKYLRFRILEVDMFPRDTVLCPGNQASFHAPVRVFETPIDAGLTVEGAPQLDFLTPAEDENVTPNELLCKYIFEQGVLNQRSLQVLERVAELVNSQVALLESVQIDNLPPDPRFKFDLLQVKSMTKGRGSHTHSSPKKTKRQKLNVNIPPAIPEMVNEAILSVGLDEKENIFTPIALAIPIKVLYITKSSSKYEVPIYESVKGSIHFPRMFSHVYYEDEDGDPVVKLELEILLPLSKIDYNCAVMRGPECVTRILVDIMGALRVLHSKGYVHGDVSPGNIGYNADRKIWNLFDFDNSRTIEEAANKNEKEPKYGRTKEFTSINYKNSGYLNYFPFDDYVGLAFTCKYVLDDLFTVPKDFEDKIRKFLNSMTDCSDSRLKSEQLDFLYLEALKLHLECTKTPITDDPSIKATLPLLREMETKYNS